MRFLPNTKSSIRTKNRLREHSEFDIRDERVVGLFQDRVGSTGLCLLVECKDCGWRGWLPKDEVTDTK